MKAIPRLALLALRGRRPALPSCESDGSFTVLGYQVGQDALYDCSIHTVRVPIFQNHTFARGLEFDLTRAVVREIEAENAVQGGRAGPGRRHRAERRHPHLHQGHR